VHHRFGAARTKIWLKRVHDLHSNTATIQRVFREIGVPVLTKTPKRRPRQMMLFEKDEPGDSVQVDVKVVKLARERVFQYTAIDDCTRYRVLRLYPRQNQYASLHFLEELRRHLPFAVRKLQCDNGLPSKSRERHETELLSADADVSTSNASPSGSHRRGITR
jgi:transposase-like protein